MMDITRNWRLKMNRCQLIATYCPETGAVILPQQNGAVAQDVDLFTFELAARQPEFDEGRAEFARAAR